MPVFFPLHKGQQISCQSFITPCQKRHHKSITASSHQAQIAPPNPSHHSPSGSWYQLFSVDTQMKPVCYSCTVYILPTPQPPASMVTVPQVSGKCLWAKLSLAAQLQEPQTATRQPSHQFQMEPDVPAFGEIQKMDSHVLEHTRSLLFSLQGSYHTGQMPGFSYDKDQQYLLPKWTPAFLLLHEAPGGFSQKGVNIALHTHTHTHAALGPMLRQPQGHWCLFPCASAEPPQSRERCSYNPS